MFFKKALRLYLTDLEPFVVFGTIKDPKKLPGAAITINPYIIAAKFVIEKNPTKSDIKMTADQISQELLKIINK